MHDWEATPEIESALVDLEAELDDCLLLDITETTPINDETTFGGLTPPIFFSLAYQLIDPANNETHSHFYSMLTDQEELMIQNNFVFTREINQLTAVMIGLTLRTALRRFQDVANEANKPGIIF